MVTQSLKRPKYLVLARAIARGRGIKSTSGATHKRMTLDESLEYIEMVFNDYLKYGGLSANDIKGRTILEVGPGDNLGIALKFIAHGAKKVICLDKFYSERNDSQQINIYKALLERMDSRERGIAFKAISIAANKIILNPKMIEYIFGCGIEDAERHLPPGIFDMVISRAVLEHVQDLDKAFNNMDMLLKEGGSLIHKVDLREHSLFSKYGMNPLEFLTVPDYIWNFVSPHAGRTNRKRIDYYRDMLSKLNYDSKIYITRITGKDEILDPHKLHVEEGIDYKNDHLMSVMEIKPRLLKSFRTLPLNDLLISGIFFVARKGEGTELDYKNTVENRIKDYYPELSQKLYAIKKTEKTKQNKCSVINEWKIFDKEKHFKTLIIKKSLPNALYHDNTQINLDEEAKNLIDLKHILPVNLTVPKVLDYFPHLNVMVSEKVEGKSLREIMLQRHDIEGLFYSSGEWLREFHSRTFTGKEESINKIEFFGKLDKTSQLSASYGLSVSLISNLRNKMLHLLCQTDKTIFPVSLKHGDYQPANIIFNEKGVTVLDIAANKNDIVIKDICNFLVGYRANFLKKLKIPGNFSRLDEAFLDGYYDKKERPHAAIKFVCLLGLLQSFEKVCARRSSLLRRARIIPFYSKLIKNALKGAYKNV